MSQTFSDTSNWINDMLDNIPVQFYFTSIEESKHHRRFAQPVEELSVDLPSIQKRDMSVEGRLTVSQYNNVTLIEKNDQIEKTKKKMEKELAGVDLDDETLDYTQNPTTDLKKRLHDKIEEIRMKGNATPKQTKSLPNTKKHPKRGGDKKPIKKGKGKEKHTTETFKRPSITSPALEDNLQFGTISFSSGKSVPKYLTKKHKRD
ncbi:Uncharacterized protein QTN25_001593 [Entamoeba marina]